MTSRIPKENSPWNSEQSRSSYEHARSWLRTNGLGFLWELPELVSRYLSNERYIYDESKNCYEGDR
jgi:hypothetical protein